MPHTCVHCNKLYGDASPEILKGCTCGSKFFFYITEEKLKRLEQHKEEELNLTPKEKEQMESDVRDIAGIEEEETPIIMDFESVKILKPGKYLIDVANLFSKERPLVYKLEDGKYIVDLTANFSRKVDKDKS